MKKSQKFKNCCLIILISWMVCISSSAYTQQGKIPPFRVIQSDNKIFKAEDLPIRKPIIIIYFSPECDHCDKLMNDLLKRTTDFKKASIVMITWLPVEKVSRFVHQYNWNKHPNIYVGTEGNSFFVRNYFKILEMPFVALYTKNGDLVKSYNKPDALNDLIKKLNNLK